LPLDTAAPVLYAGARGTDTMIDLPIQLNSIKRASKKGPANGSG
jgi:hypothetical protein